MGRTPEGFEKAYSERGFWHKLLRYAKSAGRDVVQKALALFYAAQAPQTPVWAKTVIYGALGYFIHIFDAIPDLTPVVGYSDDLGVLVAALATVAAHITPEIEARARDKVREWFGEERAGNGASSAATPAGARTLTLYARADCHLCEEMQDALQAWQRELDFVLEIVDIDADEELVERYRHKVPVLVEGEEEICHLFLDEDMLMAHLGVRS